MNFSLRFSEGFVDASIEPVLDQQIGTFGIDADAGEVGTVSNSAEPGVELGKIRVGAEKAGNYHNRRTVAVWDAEAVIHRRRVQEEDVSGEKCLFPNSDVGFCVVFAKFVVARARCQCFSQVQKWVRAPAVAGGVPVSNPGKLAGAVLGETI